MKVLSLNFLTCARKTCKTSSASFPLHPRSATLELVETPLNTGFLATILPRLDWAALRAVTADLGLPGLADAAPDELALWKVVFPSQATDTQTTVADSDAGGGATQRGGGEVEDEREPSQLARDLHRLLVETTVKEGALVCGECGHEYAVHEGIANFLLPAHMV